MEPSEQENLIFLSHDLTAEPFYLQEVANLSQGWNEIALDNSYEIAGDKPLFIGVSIKSKGMIISFDGETAQNNLANWLAFSQTDDGNTVWNWYHETGGNLNLQAVVTGNNLPQDAASVKSLNVGKCQPIDSSFPIDVEVRNMGANSINNITITCMFKDEKHTATIDGIDIPSNGYQLVTIDDFAVSANSIAPLSVSIDMVNGNPNTHSDHVAETGNLIHNSNYVPRNILLEQFSSQYCANCPTGHATIARSVQKYSNVIWVTHHCGFANDKFTIPQSSEYLKLFDSNIGTYNPAMMVNRTNMQKYGGSSSSPVTEPDRETTPSIFAGENDAPAYVALDIDPAYNTANRLLEVTVNAAITQGNASKIDGDNVRLFIFLVEDGLMAVQLNNREEILESYRHDNVLRHILTATWGDAVEFDSDGNFSSATYSYTLPTEWNRNNLRIVAFLANSDPATPNNNIVYNAAQTPVGGTSAIDGISTDNNSQQYFSITSNRITTATECTIDIFSANGSRIAHADRCSDIDINHLDHGVYIVRATIDGGSTQTTKFIR